MPSTTPRAVARVNLAAVERNCARLLGELRPGASLCAVVKADGYGHGAAPCARAALAGGANWLAVATAAEAAALRVAGIEARILVMGALNGEELAQALAADADIVAWAEGFVERLAALAPAHGARVHIKLDTGMGRLGTRDAGEALCVAERVMTAERLSLAGAMTHFATADERCDEFFGEQLERFEPFVSALRARHPELIVHAANSAATLRDSRSHFDMVRAGIAIYGMDPFGEDPAARALEPALELRSYVADVKGCDRGQSAGYGRRFQATAPTRLAMLPIGYGDGVRRGSGNNAEVLIAGRRWPLVGTISMDNLTVDVGLEAEMEGGEEAVLIGSQGDQRITAEDVARRLSTINYEVTCGISARVPRHHHRDGEPA